MVNVPGVLIVGGYMVQGGPAPALDDSVSSVGVTQLQYSRADKVMRVTPDNPTTGAPTGGSLPWKPWFDGLAGAALFVITSSTNSTVTVTGTPWTAHQFVPTSTRNWVVTITNPFGLGFQDRKTITDNATNQLTIQGTWTSNPTGSNGLFVSDGLFRDYHAVAGWLTSSEIGSSISTRGGSSWQTLGQGIGPDAGMVRDLWESVWPIAPYFQLAKFATTTPTTFAFDNTNGTAKPFFAGDLARYAAAWTALANGNTLAWELLVFDLSTEDVKDWHTNPANALNYQTALTQTIAYFRSAPILNNANLKVILVNHDLAIYSTFTPNGTLFANQAHRAVARAGTNIRVASMEQLPLHLPSNFVPNLDHTTYAQHVFWNEYPVRVRQAYQLLNAGNPPAQDGAIPVYLIFGDSIAVGPIDESYTTSLNSPTLTGTIRDSRQLIYVPANGDGEPYDLGANSNPSGSLFGTGGPEFALIVELMNRHPVTGCLIVKRGVNSSALIAPLASYIGTAGGRWARSVAAENWDAYVADFQGACNWVNRILHKQVDLKGAFVILGTNDQAFTGGGDLFTAALPVFVDDLRTHFGTRTSGEPLPVVWMRPQLAASTALPNESVKVRAALAAAALSIVNFEDMDIDDLERNVSDNLHLTPNASIAAGVRFAEVLDLVAI
jgi:hypothetical protein